MISPFSNTFPQNVIEFKKIRMSHVHWPRTAQRETSEKAWVYTRVPGHAFLFDVVHDGWWLCYSYSYSWNFHQLAAGQLLSGQPVRYGKAGGTARPSPTKSHLPAGPLSSRQPGGPPCWASPLAFGLIEKNHKRRQVVLTKIRPNLSVKEKK